MVLSDELISQLVKVTNDRQVDKSGAVVYGTIRDDGGRNYVQIDGSDSFAPIETTVEIAPGDRVSVSVRNHTATVTGNISDPAIGTKTADGLRSSITQTAAEIRMDLSDEVNKLNSSLTLTASEIRAELSDEVNGLDSKITQTASDIRSEINDEVNGLNSKITQNANSITTLVKNDEEFSEFKQTVEGFSFMGTGGTVKINGGDITLTGCIKFEDFNTEVTDKLDATEETANNASDTANNALSTANSASSTASTALSRANTANNNASDAMDRADEAYTYATSIAVPDYIKSTYIDSTTIKSPTIEGNEVKVYGTFQTVGMDGGDLYVTGYMGAASGMDAAGNRTVGVAMSNSWNANTYEVSGSYVIVTNKGVRLQYDNNSLVVSEDGIWLITDIDNGAKAHYNGVEIGSGTGGTAVFG